MRTSGLILTPRDAYAQSKLANLLFAKVRGLVLITSALSSERLAILQELDRRVRARGVGGKSPTLRSLVCVRVFM